MSAERRRHDDSLPSDEWNTDPYGWNGREAAPGDWPGDAQPDQAWAGSYRFDGTRSDEPWRDEGQRGDSSPAARAWPHGAAAEFPGRDGLRSDDRSPSDGSVPAGGRLARGGRPADGSSPAGDSLPAGDRLPAGDGFPAGERLLGGEGLAGRDQAEDSWFARPQVDQSWRYRSLSDEHLAAEQAGTGPHPAGDWPGTEFAGDHPRTPPADDWPGPAVADDWPGPAVADDWPGTAPADNWPGAAPADDWPGTAVAGDGPGAEPADRAGRHSRSPAGRRASDSWPASTHAAPAGREDGRAGDGPGTDQFAVDAFATDALAPGPLAADPFATDFYARSSWADGGPGGDSRVSGRPARDAGPAGPHVVGGRRASDRWLADPGGYDSDRAVDGVTRGQLTGDRRRPDGPALADDLRLTAGDPPGGARSGGGRFGGGRGGWDDDGRPGGRRRILVSIMAAVAVALAFGAYGLIRLHDGSALALQGSSSRPCAAHSARCPTRTPRPPGTSSGSAAASDSARPGASGPARTGTPAASTRATPRTTPAATTAPVPAPPPTHVAAPPMQPTPTPSASPGTGTAAAQVLALINQARSQAGLPALVISSGLNTSSAQHTALMAGGCGLSHQCPGEPDLGTRLTGDGVQWTSAGENIGEGGPVADNSAAIAQMAVSLTQSMLNEQPPNDGHRMNILSTSFQLVGITVTIDAHGTVWMTQDFSGGS